MGDLESGWGEVIRECSSGVFGLGDGAEIPSVHLVRRDCPTAFARRPHARAARDRSGVWALHRAKPSDA